MTQHRTSVDSTPATMPGKPFVRINFATTLNGCIDDSTPNRLMLSNTRDWQAVEELRSECDAILVGAETVRRDNPRLLIKSEECQLQRLSRGRPRHPIRVILSRSGTLPQDRHCLTDGITPTLIAVPESVKSSTTSSVPNVEHLHCGDPLSLHSLMQQLHDRGISSLLAEGGGKLITSLLQEGLVDEVRMAIAPLLLNDPEAVTWWNPSHASGATPLAEMVLASAGQLDEMAVLTYRTRSYARDYAFLSEAIELSRECPKSETSYAVGCVIVSADGEKLANGYSLELGEGWHAEEVALEKLRRTERAELKLSGATLYSSLEPCSQRKSRPESCTSHILNSGIDRIVYAMKEPVHFVDCKGDEQLRKAGRMVLQIPDLESDVRQVNSHVMV